MTRISTHWLRILVLCAFLGLAGPVRAQSGVSSDGQGTVTIDAARLNSVIMLDAPWRFHAGDDARYAEPGFDDSTWPLVQPGENRLLADSHVPSIPYGRSWARLHLHILNATGRLALALEARDGTQYAVFANGQEIGETKGFATETKYFDQHIHFEMPMASDILISVHFSAVGVGPILYFPLVAAPIGHSEAVTDRTNLIRYQTFEESWLAVIVLSAIFFACVPFSVALLLAQRRNAEYFWLAIYCLLAGLDYAFYPLIFLNQLPYKDWIINSGDFLFSLELAASIEFACALAGVRPPIAARVVQAMQLVSPILLVYRLYQAHEISDAVSTVCWLVVIGYILVPAYRRGSKESGLLAIPLLLLMSSALFTQAENAFPEHLGEMWRGHLGGMGFMAPQIGSLLVIAGIVAVVLYRFIRVSKDEEMAAAELEAARTVQRLLIPAASPATPGFSVESVYLPARQVGGDFFLVVPASAGSGDESLLAIMGDVSGKGLQAAMVVSAINGGLRMQLSRQPAEVLAHLNRMLTGHVSGFATCCAVLIEPDGRMRIANAGNPAPYVDGAEIPTQPGLPLGLAAEMLYEETTGLLEQGRQLTFVSDGVIEAINLRKELFGFERTREISGTSASGIAEAATKFAAGEPQADDMTVLTISRV